MWNKHFNGHSVLVHRPRQPKHPAQYLLYLSKRVATKPQNERPESYQVKVGDEEEAEAHLPVFSTDLAMQACSVSIFKFV